LFIVVEIVRAFGTILSWWALFLENQSWSQATAAKIWNIWVAVCGIPIVAGFKIINSQSVMSWTGKARLSKGQKDWRQTTRAIGQEKKIWRRESIRKEQREQEVSGLEEWIDWEIQNLVGIIFQTIFHKNEIGKEEMRRLGWKRW